MIDKLNSIIDELNNYKRDKSSLLEMYIRARLDKSLKEYCNELQSSMEYLQTRNEINVARKLNKEGKKDGK